MMAIKNKEYTTHISQIEPFFNDFNIVWDNIDGQNEVDDIS